MTSVMWSIELDGRKWVGPEALDEHQALPAALELVDGKLLSIDEQRLALLSALLEQVGMREAVRLGNPA